MLKKLKQHNDKGFTIIEVMIVLVIAALILLIVFLAIPALQRNSRNTSRKADVAQILAGVTQFIDNNNGTVPTGCSFVAPAITIGTGSVTTNEIKPGYYTKGCAAGYPTANGNVGISDFATTGAKGPLTSAATDWVFVETGASCTTTNATQTGSAKSIAAIYEIETAAGSTLSPVCQES